MVELIVSIGTGRTAVVGYGKQKKYCDMMKNAFVCSIYYFLFVVACWFFIFLVY